MRSVARTVLSQQRVDPVKGTGYALASADQGDDSPIDAPAEDGELASGAGAPPSDAPG